MFILYIINNNMEKKRRVNIEDIDKNNNKNSNLQIIIGNIYGQTINGTIFKYEILEHKGEYNGKQYYIVKNIETYHRMLISETELHSI